MNLLEEVDKIIKTKDIVKQMQKQSYARIS